MNVDGEDVDQLSHHFWLTPLIGLFYGVIAGGLFLLLTHVLDGLTSATLVVLVMHGLNRFLHFDGLIDLGDGLIATGPHEKKLAAMKDTRVGAGGVGFGIMFTALTIVSLSSVSRYDDHVIFLLPLAMEVLGKNALVTVAALGTSREGLGGTFVRNARKKDAALSTLLSLALLCLFLPLAYPGQVAGMIALIVLLALTSALAATVIALKAHRSFGCVNGDIMGATNELAKPAVLIVGMLGVMVLLSMWS